jgi:hypothetical protein
MRPVDVRAHLHDAPIYDVHEHHMPEYLDDRNVGLLELLRHSYSDWCRERPYALSGAPPSRGPVEPDADPADGWAAVARYVEESGSNAFVRTLVTGLRELYDLSGGEITKANWCSLDAQIRERHADRSWIASVMARARVERVLTDPYSDVLLDPRTALGELYRGAARTNGLAFGWHPDVRDHSGNNGQAMARELGVAVDTFDEYVDFLELFVSTMSERGHIVLKNALAYDRDLSFGEPDENAARRAWGVVDPPATARKAFGDFVVDRLCSLAATYDIPFQTHLGTALIGGSHPMLIEGLVRRHPATRFLLMHLAYPWSRDLLGLAFVHRNVWLDLTWAPMLSPSHFKLALHEAIEVLPDESRMMIGGDAWHVEETYAALGLARRLIGEVLQEKVDAGYLRSHQAQRLGRKILCENARKLFGEEELESR